MREIAAFAGIVGPDDSPLLLSVLLTFLQRRLNTYQHGVSTGDHLITLDPSAPTRSPAVLHNSTEPQLSPRRLPVSNVAERLVPGSTRP